MTQIITVAVVVVAVVALVVMYLKSHTLEEIRGDVYQMFLEVEHKYIRSGAGEDKLNEVVGKAYEMLPTWARLFITRAVLRRIIDTWFCKIKDLLDDGKVNNSHNDGGPDT